MLLRCCRTWTLSLCCLTAALPAVAADPPGKPPVKKAPAKEPVAEAVSAEDFETLYDEAMAVAAQLQKLEARYQNAAPKDQPAIIKELQRIAPQFEELQTKLLTLGPQVEQIYLKDPKNAKAAEFLAGTAQGAFFSDDYEECLRLAGLLLANDYENKALHEVIAQAAFRTLDLDTAEKQLTQAEKLKALSPEGQALLESLPEFRKAWEQEQQIRAEEAKTDDLPRVKLETSKGDIVLELFENEAPNTVANFISLVDKGFYDGIVFHRVLPGFMAQGGDPNGDGSGGPGYTIPCEWVLDNHRKHFRGSLSMARTSMKDSGGSQFFLTFHPTSRLDGQYTVFGRIVEGMEVLKDLQRIDPQRPSKIEPDKIVQATVLRKRNHKYEPKKSGEDKPSKPPKKGE